MAVKIGDVTIRIGASTKELEADLRKAERALSASSKRFTDFGTKMTLGLTVPIAAAGAAALQSFGDFERLQNALIAITGDASIAAEQFERLKVIAEAPGLALPQVVKASASLQAVGLSALEAEETIKQYGNAVARSGGGAAEFDGAVLALTQIASKGKISAEELNQLGERIFEIRPALQAAFGTSNSEELQKLGISAQDFIARTTAELGKLERVQGGLSNSFENFRDSVQGSLATLGKAISDSIDFPAILNGISDAIKSVTNAFNDLSPEQKRFAVVLAGLAALVGPLSIAYGNLTKAYGFLRVEYYRVVAAALAKVKAELLAKGATEAAEKATITSTLAIRASLAAIAPYVLAIGALVAVAYGLSKSLGDVNKSANELNELQKESAKTVATEGAEVKRLVGLINEEGTVKAEKLKALKKLQEIQPEYFKGIKDERDMVAKVNVQYDAYISNLQKKAAAQVAEGKLLKNAEKRFEIEQQLADVNKEINKQLSKPLPKRTLSLRDGGAEQQDQINYFENLGKKSIELNQQLKDLNANDKFLGAFISSYDNLITKTETDPPKIDDAFSKELKKINEELADVDKLFKAGLITGSEASEQKLKLLEDRLKLLVINGFKPTSQAVISTKNDIDLLQKELGQQFINVDVLDDLTKQFLNLDKQLKVGSITSFQSTSEKVQLLTTEMQRLKEEGINPASEEFQKLTKIYDNLAQEQDGVVKNIAALVTKVKDLSKPIDNIGNEILVELSKQITIIQDKTKAGLIGKTEADVEQINAIQSALNNLIEQGLGDSDLAKKLQEQLKGIDKPVSDIFEFLGKKFENIFNVPPGKGKEIAEGIATSIGTALSVVSQLNANREAELDNYYQKEKERIETSIGSEESKAAQIKALDESVAKKKSALARKQAAIDKAAAIFSATINAATAVVKALPNPILAGIVAALAAAQIAAIAAAPLPSLAIGTDMVKSDGLAMIHKGEAIVPADVAKGGYSGGGGIANVVGRIQGTDIILASDYSMNFKNRIR